MLLHLCRKEKQPNEVEMNSSRPLPDPAGGRDLVSTKVKQAKQALINHPSF